MPFPLPPQLCHRLQRGLRLGPGLVFLLKGKEPFQLSILFLGTKQSPRSRKVGDWDAGRAQMTRIGKASIPRDASPPHSCCPERPALPHPCVVPERLRPLSSPAHHPTLPGLKLPPITRAFPDDARGQLVAPTPPHAQSKGCVRTPSPELCTVTVCTRV